jgi:hypothetical protein
MLQLARITLAVMALIGLGISPAAAVPPFNDDFDSTTIVTEPLPFTDAINTSEATTAADDPDCVGQGPTVWYSFTPTEDTRIRAHTFGSDYDTTLSVYSGTRGNLTQIACNDDFLGLQSQVNFDAIAGETYFFMVGAYGSGPGGNLVFTIEVAPPPLTIDLSIDPFGSFDRTWRATIRGTVTCSRPAFVNLFGGEVKQGVGRFLIHGYFDTFLACDGETPWQVTVSSEDGRFAGGPVKASANVFAFDLNTGEFIQDSASAVVVLRGR